MKPQLEESGRIEALAREHTRLLGHDLGPFFPGMVDTSRMARCRKCDMNVLYDMLMPTLTLSDISSRCPGAKKR
jgi:hypothetical protein